MRKRALILSSLISLCVFVSSGTVVAQSLPLPGWSVQLYHTGTPWNALVARAFHFSPDGSFYAGSDEGMQLKITVTIKVLSTIVGHRMPIDAGCGVSISVDGKVVKQLSNEHTNVDLNLATGVHTIEMVNMCGGEPGNWMSLVVGACLWGTEDRIKFVKAGVNEPR